MRTCGHMQTQSRVVGLNLIAQQLDDALSREVYRAGYTISTISLALHSSVVMSKCSHGNQQQNRN